MYMHVLTQSTVVAGVFAGRAGAVKLHAADTAYFVFGHVPFPSRHGAPFFDDDLHDFVSCGADDLKGSRFVQLCLS